jgi:UDP-N-acetylglucosamine 2-epimerase
VNAKVITVVGARPQFIKCAIVSQHLRKVANEIIVHTGQHYDDNMSEFFFDELNIPKPKYNLSVGGKSNTKMTAEIMLKLEHILHKEKPDAVLTFGDTDSTLAAALVASKLYIPLIHIESGERIYQRKQVPEEINRVITDHLSDLNLCSSKDALKRLHAEGIRNAVFVGDSMYDLYILSKERIYSYARTLRKKYSLNRDYVLLTIHRLENTINETRLIKILDGLLETGLKIIWPVHPRVQKLIKISKKLKFITNTERIAIFKPLPYIEFNAMVSMSKCVLTDSGGVIRESYFAGKFSIVPLKNSWWKNIVRAGWSVEVNNDSNLITSTILNLPVNNNKYRPRLFGDGSASLKITEQILKLINKI